MSEKSAQQRMSEIVNEGGLVFISLSDAHALAKEYGCELDDLPHPIRVDRSGGVQPGQVIAAKVPELWVGPIDMPDTGRPHIGIGRFFIGRKQ